MSWWRKLAPRRSDDEITARVVALVNAGEISPAMAPMIERALRAEADGKAITMTTLLRSVPRPRLPRKPSGGS